MKNESLIYTSTVMIGAERRPGRVTEYVNSFKEIKNYGKRKRYVRVKSIISLKGPFKITHYFSVLDFKCQVCFFFFNKQLFLGLSCLRSIFEFYSNVPETILHVAAAL